MTTEPPSGMAEYLESSLLRQAGFRHAFFTRRGGVSEGPYASLSFSVSAGDRPEHVAENLSRAAASLGVGPEAVYFLSQVHGSDVVRVQEGERPDDVVQRRGDALLGLSSHIACGVRTADCVPVLVGDRKGGGAVAIHAGWRGLVRGVIPAALRRLREAIGGPGDLVAAIGPHISLAAFEVGTEVAEELLRCSGRADIVDSSGAKPHVDLRKIARAQLQGEGLAETAVDDVLGCTWSEPERFFSYRRDGQHSGRHLSAIVPKATRS